MSARGKIKYLILPLLLTGLVSCQGGGDSTSSISSNTSENTGEEIIFDDIRSYLNYFDTEENFSFDQYDSKGNYLSTYAYTNNYLGHFSLDDYSILDAYIENEGGIYHLREKEDGFRPSEYKLDSNGEKYTDLYDSSSLIRTFKGMGTSYISGLDNNLKELTIDYKPYKMYLIQAFGFSSTDYLDLQSVTCRIDENSRLEFNLTWLEKHPSTSFVSQQLGTSTIPQVENFLNNGGDALTLPEELSETRRLMKNDNFTRAVYNGAQKVGYELFNRNYFYSETIGYGFGEGYVGLDGINPEDGSKLYGAYYYSLTGSLDSNLTNLQLIPRPIYPEPNIVSIYHYPSIMNMWESMELFDEGQVGIPNDFTPQGKVYHTLDLSIVLEFVQNFSIDVNYPTNRYVPYALAIDTHLFSEDKDTTVDFHYYYQDGNTIKDMVFPFSDFGTSNIAPLESLLSMI